MRILLALAFAGLTACTDFVVAPPPSQTVRDVPPVVTTQTDVSLRHVVDRIMPVAIAECRARGEAPRCDFAVVLDDRPGAPPNAFQTLGANGQPIIGFTSALVREMRNGDELAFVLSHEAAHHIAGHIARGRASAQTGAVIAGALIAVGGGDEAAVRRAQEAGAFLGGRGFAKEFELEADRLGTILSLRAGFDPIRGVQYFYRIPDPGNQFLGTHPPNADRIDVVRRTAAGY